MDPAQLVGSRSRGLPAYFVALAPGQDSAAAAAALSRLLGIDAYRAHQHLRRPIHVVFAFADRGARDELVRALRTIDLSVVSYDQAELDAVPDAVAAGSVEAVGDASDFGHPYRGGAGARLELTGSRGGRSTLQVNQLQMAVLGSVRTRRVRQRVSADVQLADGAPVRMRGNIGQRSQLDAHRVLDLYGAFPAPIRIIERVTAVTGLDARHYEKASGFAQLLGWLGRTAPAVPVDDNFALFARAAAPEGRARLSSDLRGATVIDENLSPGFADWSARAWLLWKRGA